MKPLVRLPKQWKYWCKKAGLKPYLPGYDQRKPVYWNYLHGHGFVWRINFHGYFQRGDLVEEFDRWALCTINEVFCPTTEAAFLRTVNHLISLYKKEA